MLPFYVLHNLGARYANESMNVLISSIWNINYLSRNIYYYLNYFLCGGSDLIAR
jgi:hypothetical protein